MAGHAVFTGGLFLRHQCVDHAAVLAVDAADAALFPQLFQDPVHGLVPDHHGGIGHIHLEGGDTGGVHVVDLPLDVSVPVVDGHVEAVIADALAVSFLVPEFQPVAQGFALVGAGVVDNSGGAAVEGSQRTAGKVVGGGGAGHVQIEVGVGVDKAGEHQLAGDIDDPGLGLGSDGAGDLYDLFAVHQYVGLFGALAGHHRAAPEQRLHANHPPVCRNIPIHKIL